MSFLHHHIRLSIASEQAMANLAATLAPQLKPGDVLSLDGPLGVGKTTLTQLLGAALGVQEVIASPTFVLMHEYQTGRIPVIHVDLYRLGPERSDTFADELTSIADEGKSILLVEWASYGNFMKDLATIELQLEYDPIQSEARSVTIHSLQPLSFDIFSNESSV